jgi:hypothetical protein
VPNILSNLVTGIRQNPVEAIGVYLAWVAIIGLGLPVRKLRRQPTRRFDWLLWTYICTSIVLSVALDGARLAELEYPTGSVQIQAWYFATSFVYALLAALIWPLFWASAVVAAIGTLSTVLYLLAVVIVALIIGAIVSSIISVAIWGMPGAETPTRGEADQT